MSARIRDVPLDMDDLDEIQLESPVVFAFDPVAGLSAKSTLPQSALLRSALLQSALSNLSNLPNLSDLSLSNLSNLSTLPNAPNSKGAGTNLLSSWSSSSGSCYDDADGSAALSAAIAWISNPANLRLEPSSESSGWASSGGGSYSIPTLSRSSSLVCRVPSSGRSNADNDDSVDKHRVSHPKVNLLRLLDSPSKSLTTYFVPALLPSYSISGPLDSNIRYGQDSSEWSRDGYHSVPQLVEITIRSLEPSTLLTIYCEPWRLWGGRPSSSIWASFEIGGTPTVDTKSCGRLCCSDTSGRCHFWLLFPFSFP